MGWWDARSGTGSSPAAEETIALMSRVLAVVVPGAGVATGQCRGSVGGDLEWSCSPQLVTALLRSPAFRVSTQWASTIILLFYSSIRVFLPLAFVLAAQRTPRHCVRELTSSSSSTSCVKHFAICMLVNPADQRCLCNYLLCWLLVCFSSQIVCCYV